MKKILSVLLLGLVLSLVACGGAKMPKTVDLSEAECRALLSIPPDSVKTHEQQALLAQLDTLLRSSVSARDNQLVTSLTEEDFVRAGLPAAFHKILLEDMAQTNAAILRDSLDAESMLRSSGF